MKSDFASVLEILNTEKYYIFGTGTVSKKFCKTIKDRYNWDNVLGFLTSEIQENTLENKKVLLPGEINSNSIILISVHDSIHEEIEAYLDELGCINYIWISPYLFDLAFGLPIEKNIRMSIEDLLLTLEGTKNYAVILLAIEYCMKKNNIGKELYIKLFSFFSREKTAKKRWIDFEKKVLEYDGTMQMDNVKLTKDKKVIIDGAHRLMLSHYFKKRELFFDIYGCTKDDYLKWAGLGTISFVDNKKIYSDEEAMSIDEAFEGLMRNR